MIDYPSKLDIIFNKLNSYCAKVIIVGGFVRDTLLGIESKDIDIEVYGISNFETLEDILKEFGSVNNVGKSFGICKLSLDSYDLDFSLPRYDNKTGSGYTGFDVKIDSTLDFKTASSRRDFTINAIGYDVKEKKLLDPHKGLGDLEAKILRAVDNKKFIEDPLRVLRAVQFSARFNLSIDQNLHNLCRDMVTEDKLSELPKERVFEEVKKLLLKSKKPSIGFEFLKSLDALKYFSHLNTLDKCSWIDIMSALDKITNILTNNEKTNLILMLSTLSYKFNEEQITQFISNLTNEKELPTRVIPLVKNLKILEKFKTSKADDYFLYKLATKVSIKEVLILCEAFFDFGKNLKTRAKELEIYTKKMEPILRGKDLVKLNLTPSNEFSSILDKAYDAQMHSEFSTYDEGMKWLKKHLSLH